MHYNMVHNTIISIPFILKNILQLRNIQIMTSKLISRLTNLPFNTDLEGSGFCSFTLIICWDNFIETRECTFQNKTMLTL